jgi:radical SAM protein with 4Fe4S-binding SPASM domain
MNSNTICIMPWIHTYIETDGEVKPCCLSKTSIGNVNNKSLKDIWNSKLYIDIRKKMLNGEKPEGCTECFDKEKFNALSKRIRENKSKKNLFYLIQDTRPKFDIRYLDIRFSNICNYKCRMCFGGASHSINAENRLIGRSHNKNDVVEINEEIALESIYKNLNKLDEVYFCGGEPLLIKQHYDFLEKLIEAKNFKVNLRYSTNLSKLKFKNVKVTDYWQKFENVNLHVSIDNIKKKLSYCRHGANWDNTVNNLNTVKNFDNIIYYINITVSIFNILDLPQIINEFVNNLNLVTYENILVGNVLDTPEFYSIQALHPLLKEKSVSNIENFIKENNITEDLKNSLIYIIAFMQEKDLYKKNKKCFINETQILDRFRKENFLDVYPELRLQYEE